MLLESVFEYNQPIPVKYTCQGEDVSPPLKFGDIPKEAMSLVLLVDDPDAPKGTFDHWIVWNIPPNLTQLSEGAAELFSLGLEVKQGTNDFSEFDYRGPCPPAGKAHRYYFKLFALDTNLDIKEGVSKQEVERAMQGHIIEKAELMGTYQRR